MEILVDKMKRIGNGKYPVPAQTRGGSPGRRGPEGRSTAIRDRPQRV